MINLKTNRTLKFLLALHVFLLLFFCSKMSPFFATNEWADPNIYFNVAKAMIHGKTLYTEVFDHKGPFIFVIYGIGYLISNTSFIGLFIIEYISWLIMAYCAFKTARLYLEDHGSYFVAAIFLIFVVKLMKAGGSAEEFILIWYTISFYLFIKYFKDKSPSVHKPKYMLVHGLLSAMVLFTKINLVMFWFFPLLGIFLSILISKKYKNLFYNIATYLLGFAIITIPILVYLYTNNALEEAFNIYIELNRKYARMDSVFGILITLVSRIFYLYLEPIALFILGIAGVFLFPIKLIPSLIGKISLILAGVVSYVTIFMSPMFHWYYPIPFLIFDVPGLILLGLYFKKYISFNLRPVPFFLAATLLLYVTLGQKQFTNTWVEYAVLRMSPEYMSEDLIEVIKKNHTDKELTLLNTGFSVGISLFTTLNIVPNVKYFFKPNITHEIYPDLRDQQTKYIEEKKTEFVLLQRYMAENKVKQERLLKERRKARGEKEPPKIFEPEGVYYYEKLPALHKNYKLIFVDSIKNKIDENAFEIYYLYKRRD